ncbi:oxidoreductase [Persicitalea jodogahamensis]|uniref:Nucleoside-diphosphate sugar epimerase n=1 Tax=Persicitalea jodogahamensis TaxID=402147 RepID=A0A8J3G8R4_9BACT|nr:oxidoreductase [Persicitalea jodogahamensis]GHB60847.1 nucleoside-diphosphate sugar epimerase [Persicitalea jodogahamensis]
MNVLQKKSALVAGATGLIGKQLVDELLQSDSYAEVRVLVRGPIDIQHPKLTKVHFDFDHPDTSLIRGDDVFCCIGTTMKKAGSKEAFIKVDHDYPLQIARAAIQNGSDQFLIVTAMGADPDSSFFYNRVKGNVEEDLKKVGFSALHIFRPSLLLGNREEKRVGEKIGEVLMNIFGPLMVGPLKKYRAIDSAKVAKAMVVAAQDPIVDQVPQGAFVHESEKMQRF